MKQFELVFYPGKTNGFTDLDARVREWIKKNANCYLIAHHRAYQSEAYSNEEHYHYFVSCHASWSLETLAKSLHLETYQIQRIKTKWLTAILYGRHIGQENKPLIDLSDIETNIQDYEGVCERALKKGKAENSKLARALPECIVDYAENKISYAQLREQLSFVEFNRFKRDIDNARIYRVKKGIERDMRVIYINGFAGSGKTTLAKFIGQSLGYDIFISGSGSDPFDGYDNEECIILDDLRADVFTKAELFKLLDNNTNSSVKSRYFNKVITRCRLLIITSIKTPQGLYTWDAAEGEPFAQFARRLDYAYLLIGPSGVVHEIHMGQVDPLNDPYTMKDAPFNMEVVKKYFGFTDALGQDMQSILLAVAKGAREQMERNIPNGQKK